MECCQAEREISIDLYFLKSRNKMIKLGSTWLFMGKVGPG